MIKENQLCLVIGGGEHRPEDIGLQCVALQFVPPGEKMIGWVAEDGSDVNEESEAAWLVQFQNGNGAFKRADWLLPIDDHKPEKLEDICVTLHTRVV